MDLVKFKHPEYPSFHPPRIILEQFIINLRFPFTQIKELSTTLFEISEPKDSQKKFFQLEQFASIIEKNFTLVITYLNERLRFREDRPRENKNSSEFSEDDIAEALLVGFSHELRAPIASLIGFASMGQKCVLTEEKLEELIHVIQNTVNNIEEIYTDVDNNWQAWVESRSFDWRKDYKSEPPHWS